VDLPIYLANVESLLKSDSEEDLAQKEPDIMRDWSQPMVEYYNKQLRPDIVKYSAKWVIIKSGAPYNPLSGITNNAAESINRVLHRLQGECELSVDQSVLGLFYLQNSSLAEIQRGRAGIGNYTLSDKHSYAELEPDEILLPQFLYHPDDVIEAMKGNLHNIKTPDTSTDHSSDNTDIPENASRLDDKANEEHELKSKERVSPNSLAKACVNSNRVRHVPEVGSFVVKGARGDAYAVSLFPEKCQCPSTGICYHIKAVWLYIGRDTDSCNVKEKRNLTVLRRKSRKRASKKYGGKKPRGGDFEVGAAPDSLAKTSNKSPPTTPVSPNINNSATEMCDELPDFIDCGTKLSATSTPNKRNRRSIDTDADLPLKKRVRFNYTNSNTEEKATVVNILDEDDVCYTPVVDYWIRELGLKLSDKNIVLNNEWISNSHIKAANIILRKQFPDFNGLQDSEL
jgi:hypothetical protein